MFATLFPGLRARAALHFGLRRRAATLLVVHALTCASLSGCTPAWIVLKESGPPSALLGAPSVSVSFDYSTLIVNGMGRAKTEHEWVAAKSADDPAYPLQWQALKAKWEDSFMAGLAGASPVPVTRTVEGGTPPADAASLLVMMNQLQIGEFVPFNTSLTTVQATYAWSRGEQVADEIRTISSVAPTLMTPAAIDHLASIGRDVGKANGKFAAHKLR